MSGYTQAQDEMRLEQALLDLPERDHKFANSLLEQWRPYGRLSEKQMKCVDDLCRRATEVKTQKASGAALGASGRALHAVGDLAPIKAFMLLGGAARPVKIRAGSGDGGTNLRLKIAREGTRIPGAIDVVGRDNGIWYGRILESGQFEQSPRETPCDGLIEALQRFAKAPAEMATEYGHATHSCSFCELPLTDERSQHVGYGPICAGKYNLPWGERPAKAVA